jgi:two-component system, LuxR family, response regulator FixJ
MDGSSGWSTLLQAEDSTGKGAEEIVLVVDDDEAVRDSLKFALELEGIAVSLCADGFELLRHPDLDRARCVVLDYRMPTLDGFEVLDRLGDLRPELPIILITSHLSASLRSRAARAHVLRVLEKPLSDSALSENIRIALSHTS